MTDLNDQLQPSDSALKRYWQRIPIVIRAIISGLVVFAVAGSILWGAVLAFVPLPWPLVIMPILLFLYWKYYSGSWWPKSTAPIRSQKSRATKLSPRVWLWSMAAALLIAVVLESSVVVTLRLFEFPADARTLGFDFSSLTTWQAWLFFVLAAAVAGITENVSEKGQEEATGINFSDGNQKSIPQ